MIYRNRDAYCIALSTVPYSINYETTKSKTKTEQNELRNDCDSHKRDTELCDTTRLGGQTCSPPVKVNELRHATYLAHPQSITNTPPATSLPMQAGNIAEPQYVSDIESDLDLRVSDHLESNRVALNQNTGRV